MKHQKFLREDGTYNTDHLAPATIDYPIRVDGESVIVTTQIHYANHCWTRKRKPGDPDHQVLFTERRRDGLIEERVFCPARYAFSLRIPVIIEGLHDKHCLLGDAKEMFFRQEDAPAANRLAGWYLCIRLGWDCMARQVMLSVRSAHERVNRPGNARSQQKRFYAILARHYAESLAKEKGK